MVHSYYCFILVGGLSASISFLLIIPFILLMNFSTNSLSLYLLPLATLLNSWMNFSIILPFYSNLFNSFIFTDSFSLPPNFFLMAAKNSSTDSYSNSPSSNLLRTLMMDFNFYFPFHSIYLSFSFLVFLLFLELGLGFSDKDHAITWHGHKSHDKQKDIEDSGRMISYNMLNTCWPYGIHMAV